MMSKKGELMQGDCSFSVEEFLARENGELRRAGCKLAEAALHVAREYDGVHRLMLAVSEWAKVLADEGGRGRATYSASSSNPAAAGI
jgi:hypothetical protein